MMMVTINAYVLMIIMGVDYTVSPSSSLACCMSSGHMSSPQLTNAFPLSIVPLVVGRGLE